MSGKWIFPILALASASCAAVPATTADSAVSGAELATACAGKDGWSDPAPPARVHGNTYYVGTCGISAILVTSPDGHVLIDGAKDKAAPAIAANIARLGYNIKDVRFIVVSHEHHDHVGGVAELQRLSGAELRVSPAARSAMASGKMIASDPQYGLPSDFPAARPGRDLADGERVMGLTAHMTPGHAAGGTSWSWRSCEGERCLTIVYADSISAVSADAYRFSDHPALLATFRSTFDKVAAFDCDLLLTPHPSASKMFERMSGAQPIASPGQCAAYAATGRTRLAERLAKEAAAK